MNYKNEEVLNALKVIKNVCESSESCADCPFENIDGDCMICYKSPNHWAINDDNEKWRALL